MILNKRNLIQTLDIHREVLGFLGENTFITWGIKSIGEFKFAWVVKFTWGLKVTQNIETLNHRQKLWGSTWAIKFTWGIKEIKFSQDPYSIPQISNFQPSRISHTRVKKKHPLTQHLQKDILTKNSAILGKLPWTLQRINKYITKSHCIPSIHQTGKI